MPSGTSSIPDNHALITGCAVSAVRCAGTIVRASPSPASARALRVPVKRSAISGAIGSPKKAKRREPRSIKCRVASSPPFRLSVPTEQCTCPSRLAPQATIGKYRAANLSMISLWSDWPIRITPSTRPESVTLTSQSGLAGMTRERSKSYPRSVNASARWPSNVMKNGSEICCAVSWPSGIKTPIAPERFVRKFRAIILGRKSCSRANACMRSRVAFDINGESASARDTVPAETSAIRASSVIFLMRARFSISPILADSFPQRQV